jgi:DNA-directed RNA polymerase omega subunit
MMIEPSIDSLVEATNGNRYVLCTIVSKRAKEIETVRRTELASEDKKAISIACEEISKGKIKPSKF